MILFVKIGELEQFEFLRQSDYPSIIASSLEFSRNNFLQSQYFCVESSPKSRLTFPKKVGVTFSDVTRQKTLLQRRQESYPTALNCKQ